MKGDGDVDTKSKKDRVYNAIIEQLSRDESNAPLVQRISVHAEQMAQGDLEEEQRAKSRSLCVSLVTLLISIPALIGA